MAANLAMAKYINFQKKVNIFFPLDLETCFSFKTDKVATFFLVKRYTQTIEERVSEMQRLLPHVWGDHTYKSPHGHAYLKTHKYCKSYFTAV